VHKFGNKPTLLFTRRSDFVYVPHRP